MASSGVELDVQTSRTELNSELANIEEEEGRRREKVYVAVGKSAQKTVSLLQWTFRNFQSSDICLVHVHQPSPFIPTLCNFSNFEFF